MEGRLATEQRHGRFFAQELVLWTWVEFVLWATRPNYG